MKNCLLLISVFLFSCSTPNQCKNLEYKNGLTYTNNNLYTGRCSILYESGEVSGIQSYVNGLDDGTWKYFYESGALETKGRFKKGLRQGKWKYYYPNKKIKQISIYDKLGEKDGVWKYYDNQGNLIEKREY